MPTIDQLDPAVVAADDDDIPVSQGGAVRRVTRAQLLAGLQPALSLLPGLLGRVSQGLGVPEQVTIGSGLSFAGGVLSGAPGFAVSALPASNAVSTSDLVPVSQAGSERAVSVGSLLSVPGVDVSGQYVTGRSGNARRLADWMTDSLSVETFGAVGDGVTDDTAAFSKAIASGRPVVLGPKTYRVDGQWSISISSVLLGTPGISTLRRTAQSGGAWISVNAPSFASYGVRFDGGNVSVDSWGILICPTCTTTVFEDCAVINVAGAALGSGLVIQARDGLSGHPSSHTVRGCCFSGNAGHGLWIQAAAGAVVESCIAHDNAGYGICLDFNDPTFQNAVRQALVIGCRCWQNTRGISIGNYNETNLEPPLWGLANPDAIDVNVTSNICADNSAYAIAVSGKRIQVCRNQITVGPSTSNASGILCNTSNSTISANIIAGPGMFGIDAGGCADCEIVSNIVEDFDVGINAGGGQSVRVSANRLLSNSRGVTVFQVETDGKDNNFGIACRDLVVDRNVIALKDSSGGGVILADGPANVVLSDNAFRPGPSSHPVQAIMCKTDSVAIARNCWDGTDTFLTSAISSNGVAQIVIPDVYDKIIVSAADAAIDGIIGEYAASLAGQISFIRVTSGGVNYGTASISISGSGTGAQATAYVRNGTIVGVALVAGGIGYGQTPTQVTITGNGSGATAWAFVGLPVPSGRRLQIRCDVPARFVQSTASATQTNWTGSSITVPSGAEVNWLGVSGGWSAVSFANVDYLAPSGTGAVSLRAAQGDVTVLPGSGGHFRVCSSSEASGFTSNLGRGSPEGIVSAPPGSDYRNLDGGIGSTLWIKRVGVEASGWVALA